MLSFFIVLLVIILVLFWYVDRTNTKYSILETKYNELKKKYDELLARYKEEHGEVKTPSPEVIEKPKVEVAETVSQEAKVDVVANKPEVKEEPVRKTVQEPKPKMDFNIKILFAGAFLIILSGIVLLSSGWDILPGVVKSAILFAFMGVFIKLSKTLRKKNVTNAANIFFYISMAYLPLCLISISLFGLLGEFLSIRGEGRFIFLTAVFLATSYVYYKYYKKNGADGLFYASILSQLFTVVLGTMIFEVNVTLALLAISIYNFLLALVILRNNSKIRIVSTIISGAILVSILPYIFGADNVIYNVFTVLVFLFNSLTLFLLNKDIESYPLAIMYNISNVFVMYSITKHYSFGISSDTRVIVLMLFAIISMITKSIGLSNKKAISESNVYVIQGLFVAMLIFRASLSLLFGIVDIAYIALGIVVSLYGLFKYKRGVQIALYVGFSALLGWAIQTRVGVENSIGVLALIGLLQLIIIKNSMRFVFKDTKNSDLFDFELLSNILLAVFFMRDAYLAIEHKPSILLLIVGLVVVYLYYLLSSKKDIPNRIIYRIFFIGSVSIITLLVQKIIDVKESIVFVNVFLVVDAVLLLQLIYDERFRDKLQHILLIIGTIGYGLAISDGRQIGDSPLLIYFAIFMALELVTLFMNRRGKLEFGYDLPIQIAMLMIVPEMDFVLFKKAISLIAYATILLYTLYMAKEEKKVGFNAIFAYIIAWFISGIYDYHYLTMLIFAGISAFLYMYIEDKNRKFFKLIGITSILHMYLTILEEYEIEVYSLVLIPVFMYAYYILNIFTDKFKNNKALKIIVYVLLFFNDSGKYVNGLDELLMLLFLLVGVLYSYNRRLEGEFLASLSLIVISSFMLVSAIFVAIPWWVYLVVVGGLLLSYGVKNETKESNSLVDKVKDRFKENQ
ncbi:MAG: hypothetical protein IKN74_02185 [Clostridia bacterium]|nr:hypothetical protein [Clostridia bacterium]